MATESPGFRGYGLTSPFITVPSPRKPFPGMNLHNVMQNKGRRQDKPVVASTKMLKKVVRYADKIT
jgi:hypothetical protein